MKVLNKYTDQIPPDAVNIMRPGILGNPIKITEGRSREEVVDEHLAYAIDRFKTDPAFKRAVLECDGKDLVCCCAPKLCHGDNIKLVLALHKSGKLED